MGQRASGGVIVVVRTLVMMLVITAAISGCASEQPPAILTPIEVKVPVATPVYCQVAKLDKPELPISVLKTDSAADDTIRAYAATVAILKGAVRQRDLALEGCAAPASDQPRQTSLPDSAASGGTPGGKK
jgi:hypothetical protein